MILSSSGGKYVYRDFGLTYLSADYDSIERVLNVAKNYKIKVNIIDPNNSDSPGMNPFVYDDPIKTGMAISSVLKGLYSTSVDLIYNKLLEKMLQYKLLKIFQYY